MMIQGTDASIHEWSQASSGKAGFEGGKNNETRFYDGNCQSYEDG